MVIEVRSWCDAYSVARLCLAELRGVVRGDYICGGPYPLTTVEDAITIASVFDEAVRAFAPPGVLRRWAELRVGLRDVLVAPPGARYRHARAFWRTVELAAVALDHAAIELPSAALWAALIEDLRTRAVRNARNANALTGPFVTEPQPTYEALYHAQLAALAKRHGSARWPPEITHVNYAEEVPNTTLAEVLQLAEFWSAHIGAAKISSPDIVKAFEAAVAHVHDTARSDALADASAELYVHNAEFWAALDAVVAQLAVSPSLPAPLTTTPTAGPFAPVDADPRSYVELFHVEYDTLAKLRGTDALAAPPGFPVGVHAVPRTTNADALVLAAYWSDQLARVQGNFARTAPTFQRWETASANVNRLATGAPPGATYANSSELWHALADLVAYMTGAQVWATATTPTDDSDWFGGLEDRIDDAANTLGKAAGTALAAGGEAVSDAADAVKSGLKEPLVWLGLGVAAIGTLFLVTRNGGAR